MITKPTVFVLGAGTSMPYGFPSGSQLVEHICAAAKSQLKTIVDDSHHLISREAIRKILLDCFGGSQVEEFGDALYLSHQLSIDAFLEHRSEFVEIGKASIALFILRKEIEDDLFGFENRNKGCYQFLFSKLNTSWDEFDKNTVRFITFNYDRSLEHFLFTSLQKTYNKSESECAELLNRIPIIHVHGRLGKLPWQDKMGVHYGTFNQSAKMKETTFKSDIALAASKEIKVISDDPSTSDGFLTGFGLLSSAERIYFLGFSYHAKNMERLMISKLPRIGDKGPYKLELSPMKGTAYLMQDAEMNSIKSKWYVQLPDNTCDSLLFLRKYAKLD